MSPISGVPDSEAIGAARARADALVARMTLGEKIGLVGTLFPHMSPDKERYGMLMSSAFNPGLPRLGIPEFRITDASLGVANLLNARAGDEATALPSSLATGASFDPDLAWAGGRAIGAEARAKTFNVLLGGGINLVRDPWAGRNFEYISEDALLSGALGGAGVAGIQSNRIASTVKHFVLNAQETGRMVLDARIDPVDLRESDLLAFELALEASRPASVMTAYNRINGDYGAEHAELLNDVLKGDWNYHGWVMSDWGAVHSTAKAALAGLDQESAIELDELLQGEVFFTDRLAEAIEGGAVPVSRLDDMVARILTGMIAVGAFDDPAPVAPATIDAAAHAAIAQRVAEQGSVLLHNPAELLPLSPDVPSILVVGGDADVGVLSGGGSSQVRSFGGAPIERVLDVGEGEWFRRMTFHASSPLEAIRALAPNAALSFHDGIDLVDAAHAAEQASVVIVFATQWRTESVDLETLHLPGHQDALIARLAAANPRLVVVLETGGAVLMPWRDQVGAILCAWYPGQRGGQAIARILFGEVNPSGRLPITFPAADGHAPRPMPVGLDQLRAQAAERDAGNKRARLAAFDVDYVEGANCGYRWFETAGTEPLYPFGHGLSYTQFGYAGLVIVAGDRPRVGFDLTNLGMRHGADVPQVYVRASDRTGTDSWRLAGFARVALSGGETRRVEIELQPRTYSRWDEARRCWTIAPGSLEVAVGTSCRDFVLQGRMPRDT